MSVPANIAATLGGTEPRDMVAGTPKAAAVAPSLMFSLTEFITFVYV